MSGLRGMWSWVMEWGPYALPALANGVLVFLGVWLSLPDFADKVQKNPTYRKLLAGLCIALGLIGLLADVRARHDSDRAGTKLLRDVGTALTKTNVLLSKSDLLVTNTQTLPTFVTLATPQLAGLQTKLANLHTEIEAAREKHDPQMVRDLEAKAQDAQQRANTLSRELLAITMAPQIARQLRYWEQELGAQHQDLHKREWEEEVRLGQQVKPLSEPEHNRELQRIMSEWQVRYDQKDAEYQEKLKGIIATADVVRREMLQQIPLQQQVPEDKKQEQAFAAAKSTPQSFSTEAAARYLEDLVTRVPPPK
jgi:hypothetical protein